MNLDPSEQMEFCYARMTALIDFYCWMIVQLFSAALMVGSNDNSGALIDSDCDLLMVYIALMNHDRVPVV